MHPLQITSWFIFGSDVVLYLLVALPLIVSETARLIVGLSFAVSVVALVYSAAVATRCDPSATSKIPGGQLEEGGQHDHHCTQCHLSVAPRTKHCFSCNKCVTKFDHHCVWLNNCVGAKNYKAFFAAIVAAGAVTGMALGTVVWVFATAIFAESADFEAALELSEGVPEFLHIPWEVRISLLGFLAFINFPFFVLDTQLIFLHMFLMSQGLTTYEYMVNKLALQEAQKEAEARNDEEANKGVITTIAGKKIRIIKTLPRCMDWIIFSRCGRRRRKRPPRPPKVDAAEEAQGVVADTVVEGHPVVAEATASETDRWSWSPTSPIPGKDAETPHGIDDVEESGGFSWQPDLDCLSESTTRPPISRQVGVSEEGPGGELSGCESPATIATLPGPPEQEPAAIPMAVNLATCAVDDDLDHDGARDEELLGEQLSQPSPAAGQLPVEGCLSDNVPEAGGKIAKADDKELLVENGEIEDIMIVMGSEHGKSVVQDDELSCLTISSKASKALCTAVAVSPCSSDARKEGRRAEGSDATDERSTRKVESAAVEEPIPGAVSKGFEPTSEDPKETAPIGRGSSAGSGRRTNSKVGGGSKRAIKKKVPRPTSSPDKGKEEEVVVLESSTS